MEKKNRLEAVSSELLLSTYGIISMQEAMEGNEKKRNKIIKNRLRYEKELVKRLGGSWEEFCRVNGWDEKETEA